MKHFRFVTIFIVGALILSACSAPTQAAAAQPAKTSTVQAVQASPTAPGGKLISSNGVEFTIPTGLGSGANADAVAEVPGSSTEVVIDVAPAYSKFTLQGYPVTGSRLESSILVYPAQAYALASPSAAESIDKLNAIIAAPSAPLTQEAMPGIYHAEGSVMRSNMKVLAFSGLSGVRMIVATSAQMSVPVTNQSLYYRFYGLTTDGKYLIIVNLPVTAPFIQPDNTSAAPAGGVTFPSQNFQPSDFDAYYKKVADLLNTAETANTISPSIALLDSLVQSLKLNTAGIVLPTSQPTLANEPAQTATPAAALTLPARPGFPPTNLQTYGYDCSSGDLKITLNWSDAADNEDGYRILRGGTQVAELPAGSVSHIDTVPRGVGPYQYSIVAFNSVGESTPLTIKADTSKFCP